MCLFSGKFCKLIASCHHDLPSFVQLTWREGLPRPSTLFVIIVSLKTTESRWFRRGFRFDQDGDIGKHRCSSVEAFNCVLPCVGRTYRNLSIIISSHSSITFERITLLSTWSVQLLALRDVGHPALTISKTTCHQMPPAWTLLHRGDAHRRSEVARAHEKVVNARR